jgi:hypothetical protein
MTELEERLADAQVQVQKKMAAYEMQIAGLEQQIAAKTEENRELMRANVHLAKKAHQAGSASQSGRLNLRDAGFLLGA